MLQARSRCQDMDQSLLGLPSHHENGQAHTVVPLSVCPWIAVRFL